MLFGGGRVNARGGRGRGRLEHQPYRDTGRWLRVWHWPILRSSSIGPGCRRRGGRGYLQTCARACVREAHKASEERTRWTDKGSASFATPAMGAARTSTTVAVAWRRERWQVYQAEEEEVGQHRLATAHSGCLLRCFESGRPVAVLHRSLRQQSIFGGTLLIQRIRTSGL